jgi:hypothetical protein
MSVRNTCDTNLETVGEEFDGCCLIRENLPTDYANERNVIFPGYSCTRWWDLGGVGPYSREMTVSKGGTNYTITLRAEVTSVGESGCVCSMIGRPKRQSKNANPLRILAVAALGFIVLFRRKKTFL